MFSKACVGMFCSRSTPAISMTIAEKVICSGSWRDNLFNIYNIFICSGCNEGVMHMRLYFFKFFNHVESSNEPLLVYNILILERKSEICVAVWIFHSNQLKTTTDSD